MSEQLKDLIEKLKAKNQATEPAKPNLIPVKKPLKQIAKEEEEEEEDEEEIEEKQKPVKTKDDEEMQKILMEIEILNNNGRYRAELLHRLDQISLSLNVVAEVLSNLIDGKK
jgi:DNA replicative helicase MCM subunit Mcm2 (Cdc46/Mcm family)